MIMYPYFHTQAWGISEARYSSGQKMVGGAGNGRACAFPITVAEDTGVRRLNQDFGPLDFFSGPPSSLALPLPRFDEDRTEAVKPCLK